MTGQRRVSVAIRYHNEGPLLRECLRSCQRPGGPDEILVYVDASDTPPDSFIPDGLPMRVLRGRENRGPSYGRN
jgi:GT2 family glycosyltransferase